MIKADKAKPSVRMGRKATGLEAADRGFLRFGIIERLDSRVAEMVTWFFRFCPNDRIYLTIHSHRRSRSQSRFSGNRAHV